MQEEGETFLWTAAVSAASNAAGGTPAVRPPTPPPAPTAGRALRVLEPPDQSGRALDMTLEGVSEFLARHPLLQRLRVEVGGDQGQGVMVPVGVGRRAGAGIHSGPHQVLAADELVRRLADLAFGKARHRGG